ncbi:hypothetical protein [Variovorax sp. KK3]|uniref:MoaF-related domain-containing protein n=1 Tax=Variovorax sp. KK3 TaxID=1855728 RepID=UPI00097BFED9|nr:hypothetical protein [Variovorax sp. KK3]
MDAPYDMPDPHRIFSAGAIWLIDLPRFQVRLDFRDRRELDLTVVNGDNAGFADRVDYEGKLLRDGFALLTWREHIGSTVVHVVDLSARTTHCFVTPAKGDFMRLLGTVAFTHVEKTRS